MGKIDSRVIPIHALFAPTIYEGQVITCYIDEQITPYSIQGDNIVVNYNETLANLNTDSKSSLVDAINEIYTLVKNNL